MPPFPIFYAMYLADKQRRERLVRKRHAAGSFIDDYASELNEESVNTDGAEDITATAGRYRFRQPERSAQHGPKTNGRSYPQFVDATRRMLDSMIARGAPEQDCREFLFRQKRLADKRFPGRLPL